LTKTGAQSSEFAVILDLAAESKKPAGTMPDGREEIREVVRVGFESTTFRL